MFKKFVVIFLAIIIVSCDVNTPENQDSQTQKDPAAYEEIEGIDEETAETAESDKGLLDDLRNKAFDWLLKLGLLFSKKTIFTIDYYEGYNLNFKITEDQARSLLPDNITPVPLKIVESEPDAHYYLSWYLAVMQNGDAAMAVNRVDLFTYGRDQNGELCLYFLSSIMEIPDIIGDSWLALKMYEWAMEYFAHDTETGEPSYPHYFTKTLEADSSTFRVQYEDSIVQTESCPLISTGERFSREFVMANSQIYRNDHDKNVNYFNQSFIDANVEVRDKSCFSYENLDGFHPMLKVENLESIQFYGCKDRRITWYFEM